MADTAGSAGEVRVRLALDATDLKTQIRTAEQKVGSGDGIELKVSVDVNAAATAIGGQLESIAKKAGPVLLKADIARGEAIGNINDSIDAISGRSRGGLKKVVIPIEVKISDEDKALLMTVKKTQGGKGRAASAAPSRVVKRASGGHYSPGVPRLVGENGPELEVPGAPGGTIVPNHQMRPPVRNRHEGGMYGNVLVPDGHRHNADMSEWRHPQRGTWHRTVVSSQKAAVALKKQRAVAGYDMDTGEAIKRPFNVQIDPDLGRRRRFEKDPTHPRSTLSANASPEEIESLREGGAGIPIGGDPKRRRYSFGVTVQGRNGRRPISPLLGRDPTPAEAGDLGDPAQDLALNRLYPARTLTVEQYTENRRQDQARRDAGVLAKHIAAGGRSPKSVGGYKPQAPRGEDPLEGLSYSERARAMAGTPNISGDLSARGLRQQPVDRNKVDDRPLQVSHRFPPLPESEGDQTAYMVAGLQHMAAGARPMRGGGGRPFPYRGQPAEDGPYSMLARRPARNDPRLQHAALQDARVLNPYGFRMGRTSELTPEPDSPGPQYESLKMLRNMLASKEVEKLLQGRVNIIGEERRQDPLYAEFLSAFDGPKMLERVMGSSQASIGRKTTGKLDRLVPGLGTLFAKQIKLRQIHEGTDPEQALASYREVEDYASRMRERWDKRYGTPENPSQAWTSLPEWKKKEFRTFMEEEFPEGGRTEQDAALLWGASGEIRRTKTPKRIRALKGQGKIGRDPMGTINLTSLNAAIDAGDENAYKKARRGLGLDDDIAMLDVDPITRRPKGDVASVSMPDLGAMVMRSATSSMRSQRRAGAATIRSGILESEIAEIDEARKATDDADTKEKLTEKRRAVAADLRRVREIASAVVKKGEYSRASGGLMGRMMSAKGAKIQSLYDEGKIEEGQALNLEMEKMRAANGTGGRSSAFAEMLAEQEGAPAAPPTMSPFMRMVQEGRLNAKDMTGRAMGGPNYSGGARPSSLRDIEGVAQNAVSVTEVGEHGREAIAQLPGGGQFVVPNHQLAPFKKMYGQGVNSEVFTQHPRNTPMSPWVKRAAMNQLGGKDLTGRHAGGPVGHPHPHPDEAAWNTNAERWTSTATNRFTRAPVAGVRGDDFAQGAMMEAGQSMANGFLGSVEQASERLGQSIGNGFTEAAGPGLASPPGDEYIKGTAKAQARSELRGGGPDLEQRKVLEEIGIGRYGGDVPPGGYSDAIAEIRSRTSEALSLTPVRALSVSIGQIAQTLGGRAGIQRRAALANAKAARAQRSAGILEREQDNVRAGEIQLGALEKAGEDETALAPIRQDIKRSKAVVSHAQPLVERETAEAEQASRSVASRRQRLVAQSLGVGGIVAGTVLFTGAMQVAQGVLEGVSEVGGPMLDAMGGFTKTANKVTEELGAATVGGTGGAAEIAAAQARIGLSIATPEVDRRSQLLGGAQNFAGIQEMIRAEVGSSNQPQDRGVLSGFNNGLLSGVPVLGDLFGWIGQDQSIAERLRGTGSLRTRVDRRGDQPLLKDLADTAVDSLDIGDRSKSLITGDFIQPPPKPGTGEDDGYFFRFPWEEGGLGNPRKPKDTRVQGGGGPGGAALPVPPLPDPELVAAQNMQLKEAKGLWAEVNDNLGKVNPRLGEFLVPETVAQAKAQAGSDESKAFGAELRKLGQEGLADVVESFGIEFANKSSKTLGAAVQSAFEGAALGATFQDPQRLLESMVPQITAQTRAQFASTAFQQQTVLPAQFARQQLTNPLPTSSTQGILPAGGSGILGGAVGGAAGLTEYSDAIEGIRKETQAFIDTGIDEMLGTLRVPPESIESVRAIGNEIRDLNEFQEHMQLGIEQERYNEQLRISRRSIGDIIGLVGRQAASYQVLTDAQRGDGGNSFREQVVQATELGQLQRQQIQGQRELSRIGLARSQRELNLQLALARLQAPGETPQERAVRRREAELQAREKQRELDINKESTQRGFKIEDIGFRRQLEDALRAAGLSESERQIQLELRGTGKLIEANQLLLQTETGFLDTTIQLGTTMKESAIQTQATIEAQSGQFLDSFQAEVEASFKAIRQEYKDILEPKVKVNAQSDDREAERGRNATATLPGRGSNAAGMMGTFNTPTTATFGEAGSEHVAILRNPRMGMFQGGGGRGGATVTQHVSVTITNPQVRNDNDIDEIVRKVEKAFHDQAALVGVA